MFIGDFNATHIPISEYESKYNTVNCVKILVFCLMGFGIDLDGILLKPLEFKDGLQSDSWRRAPNDETFSEKIAVSH